MKTITIHSSKGGVGKTTVSVNIAVSLVDMGYRVCLIDYDFSSPNLQTYLDYTPEMYLNNVFFGKSNIKDCVNKIDKLSQKSELYACFSNPHSKSIEQMLRLTEEQATQMLVKTFELKDFLENKLKIDFLIIDTSPGIGLTVVNSFIAADTLLFVIRLSKVDLESTINMLNGFKEHITDDSKLLINLVPPKNYEKMNHEKLEILARQSIKNNIILENITFLGWLPTDSEFFEIEFEVASKSLAGEHTGMPIIYLTYPNNQFSGAIREITQKLI